MIRFNAASLSRLWRVKIRPRATGSPSVKRSRWGFTDAHYLNEVQIQGQSITIDAAVDVCWLGKGENRMHTQRQRFDYLRLISGWCFFNRGLSRLPTSFCSHLSFFFVLLFNRVGIGIKDEDWREIFFLIFCWKESFLFVRLYRAGGCSGTTFRSYAGWFPNYNTDFTKWQNPLPDTAIRGAKCWDVVLYHEGLRRSMLRLLYYILEVPLSFGLPSVDSGVLQPMEKIL